MMFHSFVDTTNLVGPGANTCSRPDCMSLCARLALRQSAQTRLDIRQCNVVQQGIGQFLRLRGRQTRDTLLHLLRHIPEFTLKQPRQCVVLLPAFLGLLLLVDPPADLSSRPCLR